MKSPKKTKTKVVKTEAEELKTFTISPLVTDLGSITRITYRVTGRDHADTEVHYRHAKTDIIDAADWVTITMPSSGRLLLSEDYAKEELEHEITFQITANADKAPDTITAHSETIAALPEPEKLDLVVVSHIRSQNNDHVDVATQITGEPDAHIQVQVYIDDLLQSGEAAVLNDAGHYDFNKHHSKKAESQALYYKVMYTDDAASAVDGDHIVIDAKEALPETAKSVTVPFVELFTVMKELKAGKSLDEAIRTSPTLYPIWHVHAHIIARDTRDSRYWLFKDGVEPKASANYDGVFTDAISYCLDQRWLK